jgi:Xaa-Pro dipeptidase
MNDSRHEIEVRNPIRKKKINELLLPIMRENGIDMWITLSRESHEDPMDLDIGADSPHYRGAFIFVDTGEKLEKIAITPTPGAIKWSGIYGQVIGYFKEGVAPHLRKVVQSYNPKTIGVNMSRDIPLADGLTAALKEYLEEAIGPEFSKCIVSAEKVATTFRARRIPEEVELFKKSAQIAQQIFAEALTAEVITPGKTTELDLTKFVEAKMYEHQVSGDISVRSGRSFPSWDKAPWWGSDRVIQPGDLIRTDGGVEYLGYSSDLQRNAYALRKGESDAPSEIQALFDLAIKGREVLLKEIRPGKKAHDVYLTVMKFLEGSGVESLAGGGHALDTHHAHGTGPYMLPDYPDRYGRRVHMYFEENHCISVEFVLRRGNIDIGLEDNGVLRKSGIEWFAPPQTKLILI